MILLFPIIGLALWIWSIYLIRFWKHFWTYFVINFLILIVYIAYTLYGDLTFMGHDEYGLGRLFMLFAVPIGHAFLGFIVSLVIHRKITIANNSSRGTRLSKK